jgi:hypothetical protein
MFCQGCSRHHSQTAQLAQHTPFRVVQFGLTFSLEVLQAVYRQAYIVKTRLRLQNHGLTFIQKRKSTCYILSTRSSENAQLTKPRGKVRVELRLRLFLELDSSVFSIEHNFSLSRSLFDCFFIMSSCCFLLFFLNDGGSGFRDVIRLCFFLLLHRVLLF